MFEKLPLRGTLPMACGNYFKIHSKGSFSFKSAQTMLIFVPMKCSKKFPLEAHCQWVLETECTGHVYFGIHEVFEKIPFKGHAYFDTHEVFEKMPSRDTSLPTAPLEAEHCQQLLEMASKFTQKVLSQRFFSPTLSFKSNFGLH